MMKEPHVSFKITFNNVKQFYKLVHQLNKMVGHGKENWTMRGRVLKHLRHHKSATVIVLVFNTDFTHEDATFLMLQVT